MTTANVDEAAGRIFIKDLPEDHADYPGWRFSLAAQVLKAAPDPLAAMQYLRELEDTQTYTFDDLAQFLDVSMTRTDVALFAALVGACQKGAEGKEQLQRIQARARFGCGRQALRVLDEQHKHEATQMATKANTAVQRLTCGSLDELGQYMATFQLLRHQMGTGEHKLTNAMGISLLRDRLRGIGELKATFALWTASHSTDLDSLVASIDSVLAEYKDDIEQRKNRKKAAAAKAIAATATKGDGKGKKGKKGKARNGKQCSHCGKPNHNKDECWLNPQCPSYRPDMAAKASPPPGFSASAASSSAAPQNQNTTTVAQPTGDVLARAFAEFLSKRYSGTAVKFADAVEGSTLSFGAGAWAIDSGASQFVVSSENTEDQNWETLRQQTSNVHGCSGPVASEATVQVDVPEFGKRDAIVMKDSINMASMGETCEDLGYHFYWPAWKAKPHMWKDGSAQEVPPIVVHSRVPFVLGALGVDGGDFFAQLQQHLSPEVAAQLGGEFFGSVLDEFFTEVASEFEVFLGLPSPVASAAKSSAYEIHCLTHLPSDPSCEVCQQAKLTRAPATRKATFESKQVAQKYGGRIHGDLVGPTKPSINDEVYAFVTRDDATGYPATRALKTKQAEETAKAFDDMYGNAKLESVRTDNGGEFDGKFHEQLMQKGVHHERSLPRRPQTNSRAERFHRTLGKGMGCLMLASGVPYVFWAFVLAAFVFLYARSPAVSGGPSPYELRFGRSYDIDALKPFGSACFFLEAKEELLKFEPRGRLGVVLGYGQLHSYYVLDFQHYIETRGEARVVHTRDVKFPSPVRYPFRELEAQEPDAGIWVQRLFEEPVENRTATSNEHGKCSLCELWATESEPTCRACLLGGRRKHDMSSGCVRARCLGHASIDVPELVHALAVMVAWGAVQEHQVQEMSATTTTMTVTITVLDNHLCHHLLTRRLMTVIMGAMTVMVRLLRVRGGVGIQKF